jgi:hypothetical protein
MLHDSSNQPWRCLWRGFLQITRKTFLRFTILQLAQSLFTDGRTFILAKSKTAAARRVVIFGDK